ncbi:hypothetical protein [Sedimenticola sp.]|uniref:hypothetical protein n=1 Tax=Sedimenticola sp. TaxID=1940285 RepID=UPI003D12E116
MLTGRQVMIGALTLLSVVMPQSHAGSPAALEFSADTVQTDPQKHQRVGRIYVGKRHIRSEIEQNGHSVVNIIDTENQITWVLYPQQQSYIEYRMEGAPVDVEKGSPCEGLPGAQCKKLGEETVGGRAAIKWQVRVPSQGGGEMHSIQWIGKQRSILLRQEIQNGPVMEQQMLGVEQIDGRPVEKWQMTLSQGNQPAQRSTRWFDPQLNLAIREESPGGYIRELRNITIAPQDPGLFTIPGPFKKIVPQQPGQKR